MFSGGFWPQIVEIEGFERLIIRLGGVSYAHFQYVQNDAMEDSSHFTLQIIPYPPIRRKEATEAEPRGQGHYLLFTWRGYICAAVSRQAWTSSGYGTSQTLTKPHWYASPS